MPHMIRSDLRQQKASILIDALTKSGHSLYLGINGTAAWTDEYDPPQPQDTVEAQHDFWTHLVGFVRIHAKDTYSAIHHAKWLKGRTFQTVHPTNDLDIQMRYYCVNQNFEVYRCVSVELQNGEYPAASREPIGHNEGNPINTGDGYVWKYLYSVKPEDIGTKANDDYIPVYTRTSEFTDMQKRYGSTDLSSSLNVRHIGCRVRLTKQTGWTATTYRQYGLFIDIRNTVGLAVSTADQLAPADVLSKSGYLVYTENVKKTDFETEKTDVIDIIIEC